MSRPCAAAPRFVSAVHIEKRRDLRSVSKTTRRGFDVRDFLAKAPSCAHRDHAHDHEKCLETRPVAPSWQNRVRKNESFVREKAPLWKISSLPLSCGAGDDRHERLPSSHSAGSIIITPPSLCKGQVGREGYQRLHISQKRKNIVQADERVQGPPACAL